MIRAHTSRKKKKNQCPPKLALRREKERWSERSGKKQIRIKRIELQNITLFYK